MSNDDDLRIKIILLGNGSVGKTSLATRFAKNTFSEKYQPSIGVDFMIKIVEHEGKKVKVLIFDTAGQEFISALRRQHYTGASGAVIVFDLTSRKSFEDLDQWVDELYGEIGRVMTMFVGNKTDLVDERVISYEEGSSYAKQKGGVYLESSAKLDERVSDVFLPIINGAMN